MTSRRYLSSPLTSKPSGGEAVRLRRLVKRRQPTTPSNLGTQYLSTRVTGLGAKSFFPQYVTPIYRKPGSKHYFS